MDKIEFEATVKKGKIEIPDQYKDRIKNRVRVIILSEEESTGYQNLIDQLLENPVQIKNFSPLKRNSIYAR